MPDVLEWVDRQTVDGVVRCSIRLTGAEGTVPGLLWLPPATDSAPGLVLLGHGGSGHKASERIVSLAQWFAAQSGLAALAIDGPYHGDRVPAPMAPEVYQARIAAEGIETVLDRMTAQWLATVQALGALGIVDTTRLGYAGVSMGTRFGLPLAAALGDQLRCAVLGKFGLQQAAEMHPGLDVPERVIKDARQVTAAALFHVQSGDEIFPKEGQLALFDALGSRDKRLICYAGPHHETTPEAIDRWRTFIASHLAGRATGWH